jgi:hypothetical protein
MTAPMVEREELIKRLRCRANAHDKMSMVSTTALGFFSVHDASLLRDAVDYITGAQGAQALAYRLDHPQNGTELSIKKPDIDWMNRGWIVTPLAALRAPEADKAEVVLWRSRSGKGFWSYHENKHPNPDIEQQPLYAAPVSDAGIAAPPAASADAVREALQEMIDHWEKCPLWDARAVAASVERARAALSTAPVAGVDAGMRERAAIKVEQGIAGLWYVTGLPGLLVAGETKENALSIVGQALLDLQTALPLSTDAGATSSPSAAVRESVDSTPRPPASAAMGHRADGEASPALVMPGLPGADPGRPYCKKAPCPLINPTWGPCEECSTLASTERGAATGGGAE